MQVIERHFWLKHKEIMEQVEGWITDMESISENRRAGKNIAHNTVALKVSYCSTSIVSYIVILITVIICIFFIANKYFIARF